ncbi:MAG: SDR family oxidoreductase [Opitutus sp.]|nr:SDR family oxidoreductase [Opitutus sp.]
MPPPLKDHVALVTGGTKGFGAGIAAKLAAAGARVWVTGRDAAALAQAARNAGIQVLRADATVPADWDRVIAEIIGATGRLDILVNNAGGGVKIAPAAEQSDETIAASLALNLTAAMYGCRRAAPIMQRQKSGIIVNISSVCSRHSWPGWGVYGAAKAGLENFSKSLYLELRPHGVRVTTVIPSWGATQFTNASGLGPRDAATLEKCIQPSELGQIVADLCSLPPHLCVQETLIWPTVQDVSPL